jgi:hypothetical protein
MIRLWVTEIKAIDPATGFMKKWCGPNVPGINYEDAEHYCQQNDLGYCAVLGELVAEIPCKEGTNEPDMNNMVDYEKINSN